LAASIAGVGFNLGDPVAGVEVPMPTSAMTPFITLSQQLLQPDRKTALIYEPAARASAIWLSGQIGRRTLARRSGA
jgi:hypothetical protein